MATGRTFRQAPSAVDRKGKDISTSAADGRQPGVSFFAYFLPLRPTDIQLFSHTYTHGLFKAMRVSVSVQKMFSP